MTPAVLPQSTEAGAVVMSALPAQSRARSSPCRRPRKRAPQPWPSPRWRCSRPRRCSGWRAPLRPGPPPEASRRGSGSPATGTTATWAARRGPRCAPCAPPGRTGDGPGHRLPGRRRRDDHQPHRTEHPDRRLAARYHRLRPPTRTQGDAQASARPAERPSTLARPDRSRFHRRRPGLRGSPHTTSRSCTTPQLAADVHCEQFSVGRESTRRSATRPPGGRSWPTCALCTRARPPTPTTRSRPIRRPSPVGRRRSDRPGR